MFEVFKRAGQELEAPNHIGIIMDGNGRWAKKRLQPRVFGHKVGMDTLEEVTLAAADLGVKVLTVYTFSTENWSRPADEINFIMKLPIDFFDNYVPKLHANNIKIQLMGDLERLPKETLAVLNRAITLTQDNTGLVLNFALNYGGRAELALAMRRLAGQVRHGQLDPADITEDLIAAHLLTADLPAAYRDPDLIIRTSGEERLSNFLPWQSAYSELYFTKVLWPDFKKSDFIEAISVYNRRHRRFGGLS